MPLTRNASITAQASDDAPAQAVHWTLVLTSLIAGLALIVGFSVVASTALSHDPAPLAPITAT
ncbi:hypothetical protein CKO28_01405 [Rhodovibrio sodomensis]|uniref:Uncharacterized protein n=1 Tax=Rhodovibrio sodomensis TaxID=1088 RepID=A0ABS1D9Q1_9PROT|nr:hypothetical protein [Rhodovibrio sodomensis]MBK1666701.1 hypothetical protein [Rhodovibrio sodomensis]